MSNFNFEDYRQPWETGPHWELKKEFIEKYGDMFAEDRLLCLAQAYSNIVLMNCSYPDPVMRQISLLSKPLQMRKRFQEMSNNTDAEKPKTQQQRVTEKMKSIYENSGRPFKQVKFCSSEDQTSFSSNSATSSKNVSEQSKNVHSLTSNCQQFSQQPSPSASCDIDQNQTSTSVPNLKKNLLKQTDEEKILSTLGINFIQEFVQVIRNLQMKCSSPIEAISCAAGKLKIENKICFDISEAPNFSPHTPLFSSKFSIDSCVLSTETGSNKKKAKMKSAESAVNVLIKLSGSSISSDNSCLSTTPTAADKVKNVNENYMTVLQILSENIINRTKEQPGRFALKEITKDLNMENCISFDIISDSESSQDCKYICKFFIKNILISSGRYASIKGAKELAVQSGFIKLENLSKYEIQDGELVEQQCNSSSALFKLHSESSAECSVLETQKISKTSFTLNRELFNSSLRDGFILLDSLSLKPETQKNLRNMLRESADFCRKPFEYTFEDILESNLPTKKAYAMLAEEIVGTGIAASKDAAKLIACKNAAEMLRKKYYTLKVNSEYIDGYIIARKQVFEGESFSSGALTDSNIGCKMLKNMGWSGGGLGASGIAEPVETQGHHSFGRGLGYGASKDDLKLFRRNIESMLQDYKNTNTLSSLVFSKEFSNDERKDIHRFASKYHLHSVSHGKNENRFLTVRHKYTATEVLQYLGKNGGSSSKFQLVDASKTPFTHYNI